MEPVIVVSRFAYEPDCTLSVVTVNGTTFEAWGIERPWLFNAPGRSCIPEGAYRGRVGRHYHSNGRISASIELLEVPERTEIELHEANVPSELRGCIALGQRLGFLSSERAVLASRAAFAALWRAVPAAEPGTRFDVLIRPDLDRFGYRRPVPAGG